MKNIYTDHLGRVVEIAFPPERIISLCPSLTETLYALGLAEKIVGRTRFCVHPREQVKQARNVGGTKKVDLPRIRSLNPDLIFSEKEENTQAMIAELEKEFPVYVIDVQTVDQALQAVLDVGGVTGREAAARQLTEDISTRLAALHNARGCRMAYLIWKDPYMAVGNHTYLHSLLTRCGFVNVLADESGRYPTVTLEMVAAASPDVVFLSSEPYPFVERHRQELQAKLPNVRVLLIDGEISWNGARMLHAIDHLNLQIGQLRSPG
ncbi:MAG: helical backbone metal receptor [Sulfobacillus sp.]